jgi:hypothetical protein
LTSVSHLATGMQDHCKDLENRFGPFRCDVGSDPTPSALDAKALQTGASRDGSDAAHAGTAAVEPNNSGIAAAVAQRWIARRSHSSTPVGLRFPLQQNQPRGASGPAAPSDDVDKHGADSSASNPGATTGFAGAALHEAHSRSISHRHADRRLVVGASPASPSCCERTSPLRSRRRAEGIVVRHSRRCDLLQDLRIAVLARRDEIHDLSSTARDLAGDDRSARVSVFPLVAHRKSETEIFEGAEVGPVQVAGPSARAERVPPSLGSTTSIRKVPLREPHQLLHRTTAVAISCGCSVTESGPDVRLGFPRTTAFRFGPITRALSPRSSRHAVALVNR